MHFVVRACAPPSWVGGTDRPTFRRFKLRQRSYVPPDQKRIIENIRCALQSIREACKASEEHEPTEKEVIDCTLALNEVAEELLSLRASNRAIIKKQLQGLKQETVDIHWKTLE